jgi:glycosyltransferase involved in cell wall biosynthesis
MGGPLSAPAAGSVLVANPGSLPWLSQAAMALHRAGLLRAYVTPVATTGRHLRAAGRLPGGLARPVQAELRKRAVPVGLPAARVERAATTLELVSVAARRAGMPAAALERVRGRAFDLQTSRRLRPGDTAAVVGYGAALRTLRAAARHGVPTLLEYPIAHHRVAQALLAEEAKLRPDYAPTLQFHDLPAIARRRLDAEIEAADRVLVLGRAHRRAFLDAGVEESKLVLNPLGVDLERFGPAPREPDGLFRVLFLAQLTQRKGLSYLLEGFEEAAIPDSRLVLIGPAHHDLRPWEGRAGVERRPPVPRWELPALYPRFDALVLPSLVEGLPRVVLEAMACGVPVIVTEAAGGGDQVRDGVEGYVVPIRDPGAIADRLRRLHSSPEERRRLGQAGRLRAHEFSWEAYERRIVDIVKSGRVAGVACSG